MKHKHHSDLKFLKLFVYLMGFTLIFAMLFLTYTIYKRSYESLSITGSVNETHDRQCKSGQIMLENKIMSVSLQGHNLVVLTEPKNGRQKVIIIDSCTQDIISEAHFDIKDYKEPSSYTKEIEEENPQILS